MWTVEHAYVISDIHLAAGGGLFRADEQLAEFFRHVRKNVRRCHLFLNGDILDFLAGATVIDLDLDAAVRKSNSIIEKHKAVFDELSLLAQSREHQLVFLSGNHDPELALPAVREAIEEKLQVNPRPSMKWLTNGEAALFCVGKARMLIEHGDQYDEWNWIDHELIRRVLCLATHNLTYKNKYTPPPGSRMVLNRFNPIRDKFPWLETLQPFSPSIIPLALEVILPAVSENQRVELLKAVKEFSSYSLRSYVTSALMKIDPGSEVWSDTDEDMQALHEWLAEYERQENTWNAVSDVAGWLKRAIERLRKVAVRWKLRNVSKNATFFDLGAPDENRAAVTRLLAHGIDLVIHGHTHAPRAGKVGTGLYLNTGTWGQLTCLPSHDAEESVWSDFITDLSAGRSRTCARLTFARIDNCGSETEAALFEWKNGAPQPLSAWRFAAGRWLTKEDKTL